MAVGSIFPGVGTVIGGIVGGGLGLWRSLSRQDRKKRENAALVEAAKEKAIKEIKEQRQKIIEAILACNN